MKKYVLIIGIAIMVALSFTSICLYKSLQNISLGNSIYSKGLLKSNSISDDVAMNIVFGKIDSNFNLIIMTITVLFTFFVLITFISVKDFFAHKTKILEDQISQQNEKWLEQQIHIESLKGDLSFEVAEKMDRILSARKSTEGMNIEHFISIIEETLVVCDYYSQSLIYKSDVYPKFKIIINSKIKSLLSYASELLSTQNRFELVNLGYERFVRLQSNILKIADIEDQQNLASIFAKIDFPTLD